MPDILSIHRLFRCPRTVWAMSLNLHQSFLKLDIRGRTLELVMSLACKNRGCKYPAALLKGKREIN